MVRYHGDGPKKSGLSAPKIYQAKYEAPLQAPVPVGGTSLQDAEGSPQDVDLDLVPF